MLLKNVIIIIIIKETKKQQHHMHMHTCMYACMYFLGARCSSVVRTFTHGAMGCWINPSWGGSTELFLIPASYWCNKGRGMYYPVCVMMHIKEPLLLIRKSSLCGSSGFPLLLSEWSFTICLMPYNRKIKCVECVVK